MIQHSATPDHFKRPSQQKILELVSSISQAVRQDSEPCEFYHLLLDAVREVTESRASAIWTIDSDQSFHRTELIVSSPAFAEILSDSDAVHLNVLRTAVRREGITLLSNPREDSDPQEPTAALLLAPLKRSDSVVGVIEALLPRLPDRATEQGFRAFLTQIVEFADDWLSRRSISNLERLVEQQKRIDEFTQIVSRSLDKRATAMAIVNEVRRLSGYDRVSLALPKRGRLHISAVSGVSQSLKQTPELNLLTLLAERVLISDSELHYDGTDQERLPQVEVVLQSYLDHNPVVSLDILLLREVSDESHALVKQAADRPALGVLICERLDRQSITQNALPSGLLQTRASTALARAVEHENLFLYPLWRWLGRRFGNNGSSRRRTLPGYCLAFLLLAGAMLISVEFMLSARGTIEPAIQRRVFAEIDGVVEQVEIEHGEFVRAGQVLLRMHNTELDLKLVDVESQLQATNSHLAALRRQKFEKNLPIEDANRLWGESLQVERRFVGLQLQQELLKTQRELLVVRSPIDGQVVTWEPKRELLNRPVSRGHALITVANPDGPWQLELYMPEQRAGHISQSSEQDTEPLQVEYVAATNPNIRHQGTLAGLDEIAEIHPEFGHAIRAIVEIDHANVSDGRPGTTVNAQIHCGRRALGYVLFHEIIEFFQMHVLVYFS